MHGGSGRPLRLTPYASRRSGVVMLKIREDRRELVRRIEASRIIVGSVFAFLATAYWYVQIAGLAPVPGI